MSSKNLIPALDVDEERLIKTAVDMVKIKSINPPGSEETVGRYVTNFFQQVGIETKIYPVEEGRFDVVARIPGKSSSSPIAFTGHMDVVPVSEKEYARWITDPFGGEIKEGFLYGRGSSDMKGGLASVMVAMSEIVKNHIVPARDIYFIATVDEEDGMKGSKALLKEEFLQGIPLVIVCEPTNLKICTAGKGRTYGNIKLTGLTGHGSQGKGKNVIDFARQLLNKMEETSFPEFENTSYGSSFWQAMSIQAGVEPCVVPDELLMKIDARLVPHHSTKEIWNELERILDNLMLKNQGYKGEIEIIDEREGWTLSSDAEILKKLRKIYENLHIPFDTTYFAGTTDGSILRRKGMECLILGPGDLSCVHRENERISIKELVDSCKIYFEIMRG